MAKITIKPETPNDYEVIYQIHRLAFGQNNESELINNLRKTESFDSNLSLVVFHDTEAVGHILFYPLNIKTDHGLIQTLGLVPLAVKPEFQDMGVGSQLVKEGLKKAKSLGYKPWDCFATQNKSVVVAGNPDYYGRFGFKSVNNITNNIGEPLDYFMYLELEPNTLKDIQGTVEYTEEFKSL